MGVFRVFKNKFHRINIQKMRKRKDKKPCHSSKMSWNWKKTVGHSKDWDLTFLKITGLFIWAVNLTWWSAQNLVVKFSLNLFSSIQSFFRKLYWFNSSFVNEIVLRETHWDENIYCFILKNHTFKWDYPFRIT